MLRLVLLPTSSLAPVLVLLLPLAALPFPTPLLQSLAVLRLLALATRGAATMVDGVAGALASAAGGPASSK